MTSTEYSNRNNKNEQNAKLLNKYKEKYLNVEKEICSKKINSIRACSRKELKKITPWLEKPEGLRHMLVPSGAVVKQFVQTSLHKLLARVGAA